MTIIISFELEANTLCGWDYFFGCVCWFVFWFFGFVFQLNVMFPNVLVFHLLHSCLHEYSLVTLLSILIFIEVSHAYAVGRLSSCLFWLAARHSKFKSFFIFITFMVSLEEIKLYIELSGKLRNINKNKKKSFTFYCSPEFHLQTISKLVWSWKHTILAMSPQFV